MCGYDNIIFLDLHGESKIFMKIMREMNEHRTKTMQLVLGAVPKHTNSVTTFTICPTENIKHKLMHSSKHKDDWGSRWHFLENEGRKLSLPLKHSIMETLISTITSPQQQHEEY